MPNFSFSLYIFKEGMIMLEYYRHLNRVIEYFEGIGHFMHATPPHAARKYAATYGLITRLAPYFTYNFHRQKCHKIYRVAAKLRKNFNKNVPRTRLITHCSIITHKSIYLSKSLKIHFPCALIRAQEYMVRANLGLFY